MPRRLLRARLLRRSAPEGSPAASSALFTTSTMTCSEIEQAQHVFCLKLSSCLTAWHACFLSLTPQGAL